MNHSGEFTYPDTKTPAKRTYWVVQGKLLAGAYPGQPEPTKHLARLQSLYDAGMRTFVNLQEVGEKAAWDEREWQSAVGFCDKGMSIVAAFCRCSRDCGKLTKNAAVGKHPKMKTKNHSC